MSDSEEYGGFETAIDTDEWISSVKIPLIRSKVHCYSVPTFPYQVH